MDRSQPPSGTVTFLFTDIEGSTDLWVKYPHAMPAALLRQAVESNAGYVFQIVGDACCAAFSRASDGLQAAICAQQELQAEPWEETGALQVRMALHTGTAEFRAGEFTSGEYASSLTLSRAARLLSAGHGGQVLLSRPARDLLVYDLPAGADFRDLGEHRLKGLSQPEGIFQLLHPGLHADFPPPNTLDARPNNLPLQLTSFIGREREIGAVEGLLSTARLVTLTGSGGVGKSRLVYEVAADLLPGYPDGAWLVELAPLSDPKYVVQAIGQVFNLPEQPSRPWLQVLLDYLRKKKLLLILDNCEHLLDACAQLAETLLKHALEIRILASSREALGIAGERAYHVPSLSLPEPAQDLTPETLQQSEAARLFAERARVPLPGFEFTAANAPALAQVCRRLDGIPLALELAAARVQVLRVEQIAGRLDDAFRLLTGGSRTAVPRQQTLRATIDWSYRLLSRRECILFRRLSVFAGGWELAAAEEICCDQESAQPSAHSLQHCDILDLLSGLASKSMVSVEREQGAETRYRLLETIRQYAREKLLDAGEMAELRSRHLAYFVKWAEEAGQKLKGAEQAAWYERLEADLENLRLALEWGLETGPPAALRLALALDLFWSGTNHCMEGVHWLEAGLEKPENSARTVQRGRALSVLASVSSNPGQDVRKWALEGLEICQELEDPFGQAYAHRVLGDSALFDGDSSSARAHYEASLALFRAAGDRWWQARILYDFAELGLMTGELSAAKDYLGQCMNIVQELKDDRGIALALGEQSVICEFEGDLSIERALCEQRLAIYERLKLNNLVTGARIRLAVVALWQGDFRLAKEVTEKRVEYFNQLGNTYQALETDDLGETLAHEGLYGQAAELLEQRLDQLAALSPGELRFAQKMVIPYYAYALAHLSQTERAKTTLDSLPRSQITHFWNLFMFLWVSGLLAFLEGDALQAARQYREYLEHIVRFKHKPSQILALEGYAGALHLNGRHREAAGCLAAAYAFREKIGAPVFPGDRPFHDRVRNGLLAELGEAGFAEAWADGEKMPFDQAVEFALSIQMPG